MNKKLPKLSHLKYLYNHPLAVNNRLKTFFRYFSFHILNSDNAEVVVPFLDNKLIVKKGQGGQGNYFTSLADYEEMLFLIHFLRDSDIFVDAGANIGSYSILAAMTKLCQVYSFEPNNIFYNILKKNISINDLNDKIIPYQYALGEKAADVQLINKGALSHIAFENNTNSENVKLKRLDEIVNDVNIIKIDVEGYEYNMLVGSEKILKNPNLNAIIIEMASYNRYNSTDHSVHLLISDYGFKPITYDPKKRAFNFKSKYTKDGIGWWNVIYIRDKDCILDRIKHSESIIVNGSEY